MTHLCLVSAAVLAGPIAGVVAGVVGGVGAVGVDDVVVMVLAVLESLVFCMFAFLWGCPPKRRCLPKVPKL